LAPANHARTVSGATRSRTISVACNARRSASSTPVDCSQAQKLDELGGEIADRSFRIQKRRLISSTAADEIEQLHLVETLYQ
jgi:hypothetical protein